MILEIAKLSVKYQDSLILNKIHLKIPKNKVTTLVGESGSGKSILAKTISSLLPKGFVVSEGEIFFNKNEISFFSLSLLRGTDIFYIPQNAQASLNPVKKISKQYYRIKKNQKILDEFKQILLKLKFQDPDRILNSYPFELSGGENQRVIISIALLEKPKFLIFDEPTTGLDPALLNTVVKLIREIKEKFNLTILLITHKLKMVYEISDFTYVIYQGQIVDFGPKSAVFTNPSHLYTKTIQKNKKFLL